MSMSERKKCLILINVDWYFLLHWLERAQEIKKNGYDVVVCTKITEAKNLQEINGAGFPVIDINFMRHGFNPLQELSSFIRVYKVVKDNQDSIVHVVTIKPILYVLLSGVFLKIRSILSFPGLGWLSDSKNYISRFIWALLSVLIKLQKKTSRCIYVFENFSDLSCFKKKCGDHYRCEVILGAGINVEKFHPRQHQSSGVVKLLFASRLLKSKGLHILINVVDSLFKRNASIELHVAGIFDEKHPDAFSSEELRCLLGREFIVWHGQCSDMPLLLKSVDIVCLPTTYGEGVPRILLEAAACGLPIVCSDLPGCRVVVKNNVTGYVINPGESQKLEWALDTLINDSIRRRVFGSHGRQLVKKEMSNEVVFKKTMELYKVLAEDK